MFFRQPAKSGDGTTKAPKPKNEGLPFSKYIGEDAAKELMKGLEVDILSMEADTAEFKEIADEMIRETLEEVPMVQAFKGLIFQEVVDDPQTPEPPEGPQTPQAGEPGDPNTIPAPGEEEQPEEQPPPPPKPQPKPRPEDDTTEPWPMPIPKNPPMPPQLPPRLPQKPPQMPAPKPPQMPSPRPPQQPPRPPQQPTPAPKPQQPAPAPKPSPTPPAPEEPGQPQPPGSPQSKGGCDAEDIEKLLKALEALTKGLESMGKDILDKVDTLETTVTCRSEEIRKDLKNMHQDAIDFSKKIKEVMHDAAIKDLEIQKMTLDLLGQEEDKQIERAARAQGLFGGRG